jgi:hypothetical protein
MGDDLCVSSNMDQTDMRNTSTTVVGTCRACIARGRTMAQSGLRWVH